MLRRHRPTLIKVKLTQPTSRWYRPSQGIEPEVRTFNTVIIACNMSGQAAEALKVYERMLNAGAQPTATTYTALIRCSGIRAKMLIAFPAGIQPLL